MNAYTAIAITAALVLLISLYNFIRHAQWQGRLPERGKRIRVNNQDIFATVRGTGSPAVVILTAAGSVSAEWDRIQEELSKKTMVVTYDRPGYGYSGPHKAKRTADNAASELMSILLELKIQPPYIIAGHSLGGLYAQYFCRKYPGAVKAAVFIDALSQDHGEMDAVSKYMKYFSADGKMKKIGGMAPMAALGTLRLLKFYFAPMLMFFYRNTTQNARNVIVESYLYPDIYRAAVEEMKQLGASIKDMGSLPAFPAIPLKVIFHNPASDIKEMVLWQAPEKDAQAIEEKWQEIDRRFLALSPRSERVVSERTCGHMVDLDDPELIIKTIKELL